MRVIGLDIGSRTVKRVTVESSEMIDHVVVLNSHDPLVVCDKLLSGQHADQVVATGYGRHLFAEHYEAKTLTEIRAVALGARRVRPNTRTLLDIGGQDTKAVSLDAEGSVSKFEMNDRCAAGTGHFLEVMATALNYSMKDFIRASHKATDSHSINDTCTVFAESAVISATACGVDRSELARGLHDAVVRRAVAMLRRLPLEDEIVFCGGGALNTCLHELIQKALSQKVHVPPEPQIIAALGAALSVTDT
ncbi:MAG: acyl-CoA dehydratase activase [Pseudomonadota bacterium]